MERRSFSHYKSASDFTRFGLCESRSPFSKPSMRYRSALLVTILFAARIAAPVLAAEPRTNSLRSGDASSAPSIVNPLRSQPASASPAPVAASKQRPDRKDATEQKIEKLEQLERAASKAGDVAKQIECTRQTLAAMQEVFGAEHQRTAAKLLTLGTMECSADDYNSAEEHLQLAVEILTKLKGPGHNDSLTAVQVLANNFAFKNDKAATERTYRLLLERATKANGENSLFAGRALSELGSLYRDWGDYEKAEQYGRRAVDAFHNTKDVSPDDFVPALVNLASTLSQRERFDESQTCVKEAMAILNAQPTRDLGLMALVVVVDQIAQQRQADLKKTSKPGEPKIAIPEKYASQDFAKIDALEREALQAFRSKEYEAAIKAADRAIELCEKGSASNATWVHVCLCAGLSNAAIGNYAAAKPFFDRALQIARTQLNQSAGAQSERQQLIFTDQLRTLLDCYLTLPETESTPAEAYSHLLLWKGAIQARRILGGGVGGNDDGSKTAKLQEVAAQISALSLQPPEAADRERWTQELNRLKLQKDDLEAELAGSNLTTDTKTPAITPAALAAALPKRTALIDIFEFRRYRFQSEVPDPNAGRRYVAFITRPDRELVRIDLGPANSLNEAIEGWRNSCLFATDGIQKEPARKLREQLWTPLEPFLQGCETVLVSPDSEIARLPLSALPGERPGTYLIEDYEIALVPAPQLLPALSSANPRLQTKHSSESLLVLGNIDYDSAADRPTGAVANDQPPAESRSSELFNFQRLPSAPAEIEAMRAMCREHAVDGELLVLENDAATEAAFRREAPKHGWLFLATHGFFAPPGAVAALASADERSAVNFIGGDQSGVLSGLALSGANAPRGKNTDDGILTADEVAALDLRAVDLAVLSGCQTGLGKLSPGEGALGLQRAFQVAGAKTTVASLWNVPDAKTSKLMQRFYANLWSGHMSKVESLREAQLWLMKNGPDSKVSASDQPVVKTRLAPYHWAAFQLSGDWR
jgi:CHAT domain-containing protein/tetratricopeptide (TPR) repeat protein